MLQHFARIFILSMLILPATANLPARAQSFYGVFNNPVTLRVDTASAVFSIINGVTTNTLQIVLTNTSTFSTYGNNDLLSGLFFAIATSPTLTPLEATTPSILQPDLCDAPHDTTTCLGTSVNVGKEFAFQYSATGFNAPELVTAGQYGIGAAGYNFMSPNFGAQVASFGASPPLLTSGGSVGGLDFSIVGAAYNAAASANSVSSQPLSNTSVTFKFGLPTGVSTLSISNVSFAYGTNPDGSTVATSGVPEPAGLALFGLALAGLAGVRYRCRMTGVG